MPISAIIITTLVCYFLGNHNGAICVSHMLGDDVREHGSGNAGLTNFIRNYGASRSVLVILIDVLKAVFACWLGAEMFASHGNPLEGKVLAGVAVMVGHDFPALLGFRGGKGVSTGAMLALMVDWRIFLILVATFFLVFALCRIVSASSITVAAMFPIAAWLLQAPRPEFVMALLGGLLVIFQHRANIVRLVKKQEKQVDLFKLGKK